MTFGGGGRVEEGCTADGTFCGISGEFNIFCESQETAVDPGSHEFKIKMGYLKNTWTYTEAEFTSESNTVTLQVSDCECNMDNCIPWDGSSNE